MKPIPLNTMVFVVRMMYLGRIPTMIYARTWSHMLNNVQFLVVYMSKM